MAVQDKVGLHHFEPDEAGSLQLGNEQPIGLLQEGICRGIRHPGMGCGRRLGSQLTTPHRCQAPAPPPQLGGNM